ncbi:unnamed protein product [Orchesella dallaii]|uniref:Death domain-containing protein n=1 Tax=Orchesella dallaii TaxID=48710 RepID=A0ABP1RD90_9HEXA
MSRDGDGGDKSSGQAQITLMNSEKSYTVLEVGDVLLRYCPSSDQLWLKLIQVARSLKIPDDQVFRLNTKLCWPKVMELFGTRTEGEGLITPTEALFQILEIWQNFTVKPTLTTLIDALDTNELHDCSDALRKHFNEFDDEYARIKFLNK